MPEGVNVLRTWTAVDPLMVAWALIIMLIAFIGICAWLRTKIHPALKLLLIGVLVWWGVKQAIVTLEHAPRQMIECEIDGAECFISLFEDYEFKGLKDGVFTMEERPY